MEKPQKMENTGISDELCGNFLFNFGKLFKKTFAFLLKAMEVV